MACQFVLNVSYKARRIKRRRVERGAASPWAVISALSSSGTLGQHGVGAEETAPGACAVGAAGTPSGGVLLRSMVRFISAPRRRHLWSQGPRKVFHRGSP